jgi:hypothetical protein
MDDGEGYTGAEDETEYAESGEGEGGEYGGEHE